MILLLDDPSPLVRRAMSEVFASAQKAPPMIVLALASDQPEIALPLIERSPLLPDDNLIDLLNAGKPQVQIAIARRPLITTAVAAAIAESGCADACLALMKNCDADVSLHSVERIVTRFGNVAAIRENLLARDDLPMPLRQVLLSKLSQTLSIFITERQWLGPEHAEFAVREACEKATVGLATETPSEELPELVHHLRESGHLTAGMLLRALLSGNVVLLEEALAQLSGLPIEKVIDHLHDKSTAGFRALYSKAALPEIAYPAFRAGLAGLREGLSLAEAGGAGRLKRRLVERVLVVCSDERCAPTLLALLRRFVLEAARDEARLFCDELIAEGSPLPRVRLDESRLVA